MTSKERNKQPRQLMQSSLQRFLIVSQHAKMSEANACDFLSGDGLAKKRVLVNCQSWKWKNKKGLPPVAITRTRKRRRTGVINDDTI